MHYNAHVVYFIFILRARFLSSNRHTQKGEGEGGGRGSQINKYQVYRYSRNRDHTLAHFKSLAAKPAAIGTGMTNNGEGRHRNKGISNDSIYITCGRSSRAAINTARPTYRTGNVMIHDREMVFVLACTEDGDWRRVAYHHTLGHRTLGDWEV